MIEYNTHLGGGESAARGMIEHSTYLIERNPREPLDELRYLSTILEILEQRRNRHARVAKYLGATGALRIALNRRAGRLINHKLHPTIGLPRRLTQAQPPPATHARKS